MHKKNPSESIDFDAKPLNRRLSQIFFRPADGGLAKSTAAKRNIFFRPPAGGQFCGLPASRGKNVSNVKTII